MLGLSEGLRGEVAKNAELRTAGARPAGEIYTGVLYDALDLASLDTAAKRRAARSLLVFSGLWGAVRVTDRIPSYRCSMGVKLPGLGALGAHWRAPMASVLPEAAGTGSCSICGPPRTRPRGSRRARSRGVRRPCGCCTRRPGRSSATSTRRPRGGSCGVCCSPVRRLQGPAELVEALRDLGYAVEAQAPAKAGQGVGAGRAGGRDSLRRTHVSRTLQFMRNGFAHPACRGQDEAMASPRPHPRFLPCSTSRPSSPSSSSRTSRDAVPLARALVAGGLPAIEVTLRTPAALDAIRAIADEVPDAVVGAGTVITPAQVAESVAAGARFLVSPGWTDVLLDAMRASGVPFLPGVSTTSEVVALLERGVREMKFFPAQAAGGTAYLKSLAGPLPQARFCPTGGIGPAPRRSIWRCPTSAAWAGVGCSRRTRSPPGTGRGWRSWPGRRRAWALARAQAPLEGRGGTARSTPTAPRRTTHRSQFQPPS